MARKIKPTTQVRHRLRTLRTLGFAVERFENYIHQRYQPHAVDTVLLTCLVQGRARHVMGPAKIEIQPGSVGITNYGQTHDLLTDRNGIDVINLYLNFETHAPPLLPHQLQTTMNNLLSPHPSLVNRLNRRISLTLPSVDRMLQPLEQMRRELACREPGYEAVAKQALSVFLIECCRAARNTDWYGIEYLNDRPPDWLDGVRRTIDESFDEPLTLEDLAESVEVSREHLCRAFKTYTGRTPMAYLNDKRIQAAMWQLRSTASTVLDIAINSGFHDLSHFNKRFKQLVKMTPSQYRRSFQ